MSELEETTDPKENNIITSTSWSFPSASQFLTLESGSWMSWKWNQIRPGSYKIIAANVWFLQGKKQQIKMILNYLFFLCTCLIILIGLTTTILTTTLASNINLTTDKSTNKLDYQNDSAFCGVSFYVCAKGFHNNQLWFLGGRSH